MTYTRLNPNSDVEIRCGTETVTVSQGQNGNNKDVTFSQAFTKSNIVVVATVNEWRTPYTGLPKLAVLTKSKTGFKLHAAMSSTQSSDANLIIGWIAIAR